MWERIPKFFRSFYFLVTAAFLTWMFFFDENDFIRQYQMSKKLSDLEEERDYYVSKIEEVEKDRKELMSNADLLEKFAREKYLMKKPTEDVFLVIPEEKRAQEIEAQQAPK
jgi:cell division protein FtsB